MNAHVIVGTLALIVQLGVIGYALWLKRKSGGGWTSWSLGVAFALMVLLRLSNSGEPLVDVGGLGLPPQAGDLVVSLLLLVGLSHLSRRLSERQKELKRASQTADDLEAVVDKRTADLVESNMKLARELEQCKRTEVEIKASREVYRGLLDSVDGIVFECRASDLHFSFVSSQSARLLGYASEDWLASITWRDLIHSEDYDRFLKNLGGSLAVGEKRNDGQDFRLRMKNQEIRWFQCLAGVVSGALGEERIRGVLLDVTERRQVEDERRQQQNLESIGRLAGGVAHELNNSLTVIQGYSQLLIHSDQLEAEAVEHVKRVSQASDQAARLAQQLLALSGKQEVNIAPLDINGVVKNLSSVLRALVGDAVAVHLKLAERLPLVEADSDRLGQALVTLVLNSRDAMSSGGQLLIQTEAVAFGETSSESDPEVRAGAFVCLSVSDTGIGIPSEIRPHLFEPYFRTKEAGKGTGLALSTVYGIMKQLKGWVRVTSDVNQGTTFRLFLPLAPDQERAQSGDVNDAGTENNHETILLVDDDPGVLDLVKAILQSHGYQVLSARSGLAALKLWNEYGTKVDLLLTDLVMSDGLSGLDLLGQLRQDRPELRAIIMSGYASPELSLSKHTAFIQKPYRPASLLKAVHDSLVGDAETSDEFAHQLS
jgi:PAS domain S-box-containing protein